MHQPAKHASSSRRRGESILCQRGRKERSICIPNIALVITSKHSRRRRKAIDIYTFTRSQSVLTESAIELLDAIFERLVGADAPKGDLVL